MELTECQKNEAPRRANARGLQVLPTRLGAVPPQNWNKPKGSPHGKQPLSPVGGDGGPRIAQIRRAPWELVLAVVAAATCIVFGT